MASAEQTGTLPEGATSNPLLEASVTPFGLPPFDRVTPDHFRPAFDRALAEHRAEIAAVAGDPAAPTFANTVDAFERAGRTLDRVSAVFFGLAGAHTSDALQAVQRGIAPVLARHRSAIFLDAALFRRVDNLFAQRERLGLTPEQTRVLERLHAAFVRAGARLLDGIARERLTGIDERLAALGTLFGQNVLAVERAWVLVLEAEEDLAGLPDFVRAAAARAAADRGLEGRHAITLARSSVVPFLQFSSRRDLRERAFAAWTGRGDSGGDTGNGAIAAETLALRAERARLLDHPTYAHYRLDDTMAKTPEAVRDLLDRVWAPARVLALRERDELQAVVAEEGGNFTLAPWDWRHYAEKVRRARHDLDEAEIKPYLRLDNMVAAAFDVAHRLFGITFTELRDPPVYHPDVRVWEACDAGGRHLGLFLGDYFARPSMWADGVYFTPRLDHERQCLLVLIGADAQGRKELLAVEDGFRESAQSWRELLLRLRDENGLALDPELATGDGAMGFWQALHEVWPKTRQQRCRVHKTANVLNALPKSVHGKAKQDLHAIHQAENRATAEAALDRFVARYGPKYAEAATCLTKDREALLASYAVPAEHWKHVRTTNPIESTFATVRLRTDETKGCLSRQTALAMVFKLARSAERCWCTNPMVDAGR